MARASSEGRIFAYGTLEVPELMAALVGRRPPGQPAVLEGYARFLVRGQVYPGIVASPGSSTDGILYDAVDEPTLALLDRFEGPLYERRRLRVRAAGDARLPAQAYVVPEHRSRWLSTEPWNRSLFVERHLSEYVAHCTLLRRETLGRIESAPE